MKRITRAVAVAAALALAVTACNANDKSASERWRLPRPPSRAARCRS